MISICIPTIRPQNIPELIRAIHDNAGIPESEYEILIEEDVNRIGCPAMLKKLVERSSGDMVAFIGDDTMPGPGFLKYALDAMRELPDGFGVVGLNSQPSRHAAHFIASKKMLDILPDRMFFHTDYRHCWCDHELTDIAIEAGRFVFCDKAILKHNHPIFNTGQCDPDYLRIYSDEFKQHDLKTYHRRKRERYGFKLGIAWPLIDKHVYSDFVVSFIALEKPDYTLLLPKFPTGEFVKDIAATRNNLVEQALYEGCTHLIFMDTDQVYRDPQTIMKMLGHTSTYRVVGAPVHRRYPPFDCIMMRGEIGKYRYVPDDEIYSGKTIDVDATGTGCILIECSLFDELETPWFVIGIDPETGRVIGEDIGFCHRVRQQGIPIVIDTSIEIGHITAFEVNRGTYELFRKINGFRKRIDTE